MFKTFDLSRFVTVKMNALNYIVVKVLLQSNDIKTLHSISFFFCKMILKKYNYKIYDKKLFIIIKVFKEWRSETHNTTKFVIVFINHKNLKHFIITQKLNYCQIY